jgi:cytochrome c-type biogenesis protein CcmH
MRKTITLCLLLLALLPAAAYGQDNITDDQVNEIAKDLYCPVCESTPLDVCPTQACADWRELIRTKLAAGESRQDVLDYFARQYGDGVLADPPRRGVSLIVLWVVPLLGILLGLLVFARLLRGMRASAPATPTPTAVPAPVAPPGAGDDSLDDYIARVERDLKQ